MMNTNLNLPLFLTALRHLNRSACALGMFAALIATVSDVQAQTFPDRMIRIVVPYTAGTGPDAVARVLAEKMSTKIGQAVMVDNKVGASGNIGAREVEKALPDGYTLLLASNSMITAALMSEGITFDLTKDFTPIARVSDATLMLVANPDSGVKDMNTLVAMAKQEPGKLRFSSPGVGSLHHMAAERIESVAGIQLMHIPYKGSAGAMSDVMGGHVDLSVLSASLAMQAVKSKKLIPIAVTSPNRYSGTPEVPTLRELGFQDADTQMWFAVLGPKGMPEGIVGRLNKELGDVLKMSEVRTSLALQGFDPAISTPQKLGNDIATETRQWKRLIDARKGTRQ